MKRRGPRSVPHVRRAYLRTHEPVMRRNGERGAAYSAAHQLAMTAAKGNNDLIKILKDLKIRETKPKKKAGEPVT